MDGQRVKAWEARCIEEQPPACAVGCPLRVDVRGMLEKAKAGDFAARLRDLRPLVALPAVLGRICDHPCETVCRRAEAGGAIRIGAVERACVEAAYRNDPPRAAASAQGQTRRRRRRRACRPHRRLRPGDEGMRGYGVRSRAAPADAADARLFRRAAARGDRRRRRRAGEARRRGLLPIARRGRRRAARAGDVDRRLRCGSAGDRRRVGGPIRRRAERDG